MTAFPDRFDYIGGLGESSEQILVGKFLDTRSGEEVAVKMAKDGDYIAKRFQREIEAMQTFAGPHVMPILDADNQDEQWYSMPVASRELTASVNGLSQEERAELALDVVRAAAVGLREFHATGQVHRDLKPENILYLESGSAARWVIADFGIARNTPGTTTSEFTRQGSLLGTLRWAAPEQLTNAHDATPQTDVYSLGAIVAWIMTDQLPSQGQVPCPRGRFRAAVRKATTRTQTDRYSTVDELLTAMEADSGRFVGTLTQQLEKLLESPINYAALGEFVDQNQFEGALLLRDLPKGLDIQHVNMWASVDQGGLLETALTLSKLLSSEDHRGGVRFKELEPPLHLVLNALRALVQAKAYELAEELAIKLFDAASFCDQWAFNRALAKWLKSLSDQPAEVMIHAIEQAGTAEGVRASLDDEWSEFSSQLLQRWAT